MRALSVFEPHVLHACCSSFTLIKCASVCVCNPAPATECYSNKIITQPHCFWHLTRNWEERRGEEKPSWGKHSPVVKGFQSKWLFSMWWQVYFHTNFQASPCESDSTVYRQYTGNAPPAGTGEVGNFGSIFLCYELICSG